ncbi:GNAT family N-acetyltransferase [uncultured Ilyobacter sp.]|uniref:GNAT family N-acetyltransferase n=1 Tax=uncultured Ilyobacter sp. TaxID=544433 RepID=UPI0029C6F689|nr:GNAT family N-acetyltransferase [uncultured Ilyobacter sp.]
MEWKIKKFDELSNRELYDIMQQRVDVFVVEQNCVYAEIDGKDIDAYHLFATDDDKVIAYTRILLPGVSFDEVSIGRVLVNMGYRGEGLGQELMKKTMEFVTKDLKEKSIRISAQEYLLEFYLSLGFEEASDIYIEDGIPHIDMLFTKSEQ